MSLHSFDPEIAARVGINAAVIYQNFIFWCQKNHANRKHIRDGYVWTYNSRRALAQLFPYLSEKQIRTALEKLVSTGMMVKGDYNQASYDRTNWYAPAVTAEWLGQSIGQDGPNDWPIAANGAAQKGQPIPDSKPNSKTDSKLDIDAESVFDAYNAIAKSVGWPLVQSRSKARENAAAKRIKECGGFENWRQALERAARSDFLSGKATGTTPATFDWLNKPSNFTKLMEGNYDNRTRNNGAGTASGRKNGADPALEQIARLAGLS